MSEQKENLKPTTFKKTKVIGKQELVNRTTGEVIECDVVEFEDRDANFEKIWLGHVLSAIDDIGNAKIKVLTYLIKNKSNADNTVIATQDEIAAVCGVSRQTVNTTLKALENHEIISKHRGVKGVYMLNPNVIFKGTHNKRLNVLLKYKEDYQQELNFDSEEESEKKSNVKELKKQKQAA